MFVAANLPLNTENQLTFLYIVILFYCMEAVMVTRLRLPVLTDFPVIKGYFLHNSYQRGYILEV